MYDEMTNADLIVVAYEKAHPKDNPTSENADVIDALIARIRNMERQVRQLESSVSLNGNTPDPVYWSDLKPDEITRYGDRVYVYGSGWNPVGFDIGKRVGGNIVQRPVKKSIK